MMATGARLPKWPTRDPLEGAGDRRVGQLGHEPDVGTELADPQRRLQRMDLLGLGADHRGGGGQPSLDERVTQIRRPLQVRHAPVLEDAGEPKVGIGVDHDHGRPAQVQLLDDSKSDPL
jgi:hypothetical protein